MITQISIPQIKPVLRPQDPGIRRFSSVGIFARIKKWLWIRWSYPAEIFGEDVTVKVATIDSENMGRLVATAVNALKLDLNDIEYVIMGSKQAAVLDYQHMLKCQEFSIPMAPGGIGYGRNSIMGIRVRVVPWYDGVLVVPRVMP